MQVILLQSIHNVGELGDTVKVKPGFARNFLIPRGQAVAATPANIAEFEARRAELETQQAEARAAAVARQEALEGLQVSIAWKAGEEGKLFGSVGAADVAAAIAAAGHDVARQEVRLPGESIRHTGEYAVVLHLYVGVDANVTLNVVPEEG